MGKTFKGEGNAVLSTVTGVASAIRHPISTAQGLWHAFWHPFETGGRIVSAVAAKVESGSEGQGEVIGDVILAVAGPAVVAKTVAKVRALAVAARADRGGGSDWGRGRSPGSDGFGGSSKSE